MCTGNVGKLQEMRALLPDDLCVVTLAERDLPIDLPETGDTLEANALEKARYAHIRTGMACVADDSGLEVHALNGQPGVRSARFAGEAKDTAANMRLLLEQMEGVRDRSARFRTVIALVLEDGTEILFHGQVAGSITTGPRGMSGFGYDPVFVPEGHQRTFAEMSMQEKNALSHRARAMQALAAFLRQEG